MNRRIFAAISASLAVGPLLVATVAAKNTTDTIEPSTAVSDLQTQVAALQTQVSDLQTQVPNFVNTPARSDDLGTPSSETLIKLDDWDIEIKRVFTSHDLGEGANEDFPRGVYIVVSLRVVNTGKHAADFPYDAFVLQTSDGYEFGVDVDGTWDQVAFVESNGDYSSFNSRFDPLLEYGAAVVFDIPEKHGDLTLTSTDGQFSVPLTVETGR